MCIIQVSWLCCTLHKQNVRIPIVPIPSRKWLTTNEAKYLKRQIGVIDDEPVCCLFNKFEALVHAFYPVLFHFRGFPQADRLASNRLPDFFGNTDWFAKPALFHHSCTHLPSRRHPLISPPPRLIVYVTAISTAAFCSFCCCRRYVSTSVFFLPLRGTTVYEQDSMCLLVR